VFRLRVAQLFPWISILTFRDSHIGVTKDAPPPAFLWALGLETQLTKQALVCSDMDFTLTSVCTDYLVY
jgi:hypothetical protein